jgi:hypothetical protein
MEKTPSIFIERLEPPEFDIGDLVVVTKEKPKLSSEAKQYRVLGFLESDEDPEEDEAEIIVFIGSAHLTPQEAEGFGEQFLSGVPLDTKYQGFRRVKKKELERVLDS